MGGDTTLERVRDFGKRVLAKPAADARRSAEARHERLVKERAEARATEPQVFFDCDGAWLNGPMLRKVCGPGLKRPEMSAAPLPQRTFDGTSCRRADAVQALLQTGALGEGRRAALIIAEVHSLDDSKEAPPGMYQATQPVLDFAGRPYGGAMARLFREAADALAILRGYGKYGPARGRRVPDAVLPHVWAARHGDAFQGPVASVEECLPVEIGASESGMHVLWIRSLSHVPAEVRTTAV